MPATIRRSFSATDAAASASVSGRTTRNSSPPYRPAMSVARTLAASSCADVAQDAVAGGVAVGVVEALEVIEVQEDDRHRVPVAGGPRQLLVHAVQDGLPGGDAGQRVDRRQAPRVADAVGERAERGPEPRIADPVRVDRDERALVLGAG